MLIDAVDGHELEHLVEENPELDWDTAANLSDALSPGARSRW